MTLEEAELSQAFNKRVVLPLLSFFGGILDKYTPKGLRNRTAAGLTQAGRGRIDPSVFLGIRGVVAFGLTGAALLVFFLTKTDPRYITLMIVFFPLAGYLLPDIWLRLVAVQRKAAIIQTLPDLLDILSVCVDAGLGFDQALFRTAEKLKGPLAYEVLRTFQEIQMGHSRANALRAMSERIGMPDLTSFVAALIQADQMGVSVSSVLRIQSDSIRSKRRQRAEEAAMKAPLKLLFPLIVFIFPTLFLILLGPALINLIENFSSK